MIVSASRRTDIPAFHSEWFMNRISEGFAMVRNPSYRNRVYRVPLDTKNCDLIVFISKNPEPMIKHLDELENDGYLTSFQITINPYGKELEPNVPSVDSVVKSFIDISEIVGKKRIFWRYDPVIFSEKYDFQYHLDNFELICSALENYTERCCFNFLDYYDINLNNLSEFSFIKPNADDKLSFASEIMKISEKYGIRLTHCNDEFKDLGIADEGCISKELVTSLNVPYSMPSIPVRNGCKCVKVTDIGEYDTCMHNCRYCYANSSDSRKRFSVEYNKNSPFLVGDSKEEDEIIDLSRKTFRITDF